MLVAIAIEIAVAAYYFWRRQRTVLLLSFVALAVGCLILAIDLFSRRLPLGPPAL